MLGGAGAGTGLGDAEGCLGGVSRGQGPGPGPRESGGGEEVGGRAH